MRNRLQQWLAAPRPVDLTFAILLFWLHLIACALFGGLLTWGSGRDLALVVAQVLLRGVMLTAVTVFLLDCVLSRLPRTRLAVGGAIFAVFLLQLPDYVLFMASSWHTYEWLRVGFNRFWDLYDILWGSYLRHWQIAVIFSLIPGAWLVGVGFARGAARRSRKLGYQASTAVVIGVALTSFFALTCEEAIGRRVKDARFYRREVEVFPWYTPMVAPPSTDVAYTVELAEEHDRAADEEFVLAAARAPKPARRPHIFMLVLESVRASFVDARAAPNMTRFAAENLSFPGAHSNANHTFSAWFALFHGQYPFYAHRYRHRGAFEGAVPLRILKAWGYRTAMFTATSTEYFDSQRMIFGDEYKLLDSRREFPHEHTGVDPAVADQRAIHSAIELVDRLDGSTPHFVPIFLLSAHWNYFVPRDRPLPFQPFADPFEYTQWRVFSNDIELVKNRYRNCIHHIDGLFGELVAKLKARGLYDDSIILVLGDHGEEFFEFGSLAHSSNICEPQITPAFSMKLPGRSARTVAGSVSHLQVLPTVLAELGYRPPSWDVFDGQPLLDAAAETPPVLVNTISFEKPPTKYAIHTGDRKLYFLLDDSMASTTALSPIQVTDGADKNLPLPEDREQLRKHVDQLYTRPLKRVSFIKKLTGPHDS